jgi:hypothetical protein
MRKVISLMASGSAIALAGAVVYLAIVGLESRLMESFPAMMLILLSVMIIHDNVDRLFDMAGWREKEVQAEKEKPLISLKARVVEDADALGRIFYYEILDARDSVVATSSHHTTKRGAYTALMVLQEGMKSEVEVINEVSR